MKKVLLSLLLLMCLFLQAQENPVEFKLQSTGEFLSKEGKDFIVVEFDGKTTSELYDMVKGNVMSLYNSPKEVMSESGDNVITIFARDDEMWYVNSLGAKGIYGGYYKLVFKFKDGRIRIDSPTISKELSLTDGFFTNTIGIPKSVFLSNCAKKVCETNSNKNNKKKTLLENVVNVPINYLLGLTQEQQQKKTDEDW